VRIALIDRPRPSDRPAGHNRFRDVAALLEAAGHEVRLIEGAPPPPAGTPPVLTGLNRAVAAAPLVEAHALAHHLAGATPDLVIAPLGGGIAQAILMARACREEFSQTRVALWHDTPSRNRFLHADDSTSGMAPLIADALERQAIALADALIIPDESTIQGDLPIAQCTIPSFHASLPVPVSAGASRPTRIEELVFVGPTQRSAGMVEFVEAVERLSADGLLANRLVTFLGPARTGAQGIGKEWLGLRARRWPFPFKVIDGSEPEQVAQYLNAPSRLAIAIADDPDGLLTVRHLATRHIALARASMGESSLVDRVTAALRAAMEGAPSAVPAPSGQPTDWPALAGKLAALPLRSQATRQPPEPGVTICILHHNRLTQLAEALASIPTEADGAPVEVVVLDNASSIPSVEEEIRRLAGERPHLRIVRFERSVPQPFALNRGLAEARFGTVIFHDDDNTFAPGGVQRLMRAIAAGDFDVAVTALEIFDEGASDLASTAGRLIFLGAAHSAGLFFNGFGDTAMAVRRDSFLAFGGFHFPGYDYPGLDWVTLAKAQAAGLRIGALQWPAVRYRRNTASADLSANKLDQEGVRRLVFDAYGPTFDGPLLARYAQKLHLEEL
jgi:hypothetical protein